MKKRHKSALLFIVILAIWSLVGCGVSKDEHAKVAAELEKTKAELQKAQATVAEQKKLIMDIPNTMIKRKYVMAAEYPIFRNLNAVK